MEEQFISYEEALDLKELGFDELCLARFDGGGFRMLPVYDPLKNSEIKESWFCVTPLYQQAFRWFRKTYRLNPEISVGVKGFSFMFYEFIDSVQAGFSIQNINYTRIYFETYEEAELACLRKLIEIVKNK